MAIEDFLSVASDQLDSEPDQAGLPSYLVAANNHNIASGSGFSVTDPGTWGDGISDLGKFTMTATARAVTSVYNIVPDAINFFGGNVETADTYNVLAKLDHRLSDYYSENEKVVNVVGDVVGSFVPGLAGVKALNMGQKALAAASAGKTGFNMASAIGLLPTRATQLGVEAGRMMAATSQSFKFLNANVLKSVSAGFAQNALESAAFLGASQLAMHSSPIFEEQDVSDIFWNSVWGGGVGAAIGGSIAAARTYGAIKQGVKEADRVLNPSSLFAAAEQSAKPTDKIIIALHEIYHPPVMQGIAGATDDTIAQLTKTFETNLTKRRDTLINTIRTETHKLTGDKELANIFVDTMSEIRSYEDAVGNVYHMAGLSRVGTEKTAIEKLVTKIKDGIAPAGTVEPNLALKYVYLSGERAGQITDDAPVILNIADTVKTQDAVFGKMKSFKFKLNDDFAPSAAKDHFEAEARYIWSAHTKPDWSVTKIADRDLPLLEKAIREGVEEITLKSGRVLQQDEIFTYLQEAKRKEAYLLQEAYPNMTVAEIAKRTNVKQSLLEGFEDTKNPVSDWIARDYSNADTYLKPQVAKIAYDVKPMLDQDGFVMDAIAHAKANQKELRQATQIAFASHFPEVESVLPFQIGDRAIYNASRHGAGGGMFSMQNENYGTIGSIAQQIGSVVNKTKQQIFGRVDDTFTAHTYAIMNNQAAKDDLVKAYNLLLGSSEKYVITDDGFLRMAKVEQAMKSGSGKWPALLDKNSAIEIKLNSQEAIDFLKAWTKHNDDYLQSASDRLKYQVGHPGNMIRSKGTVYIPPPDPKNYNYFAFVSDKSVTGVGEVRMIHAATEADLEKLVAKVNQTGDFKVITKKQSEEFHKAMNDYQYSLGINEGVINTGMQRKGVSAPHFAVTDANKIISEMMDWRKRADLSNFREWVKAKYAPEVEALNQLGKAYDDLAVSRKAYTGRFGTDAAQNPYHGVINTMLDVSAKEQYPVWTPLNRLLENSVSRVYARLTDSLHQKADLDEFERMRGILKEAGIKANFVDPATMLLANHTAPKPVLEDFVRKANSALSFLMLRADPLNALNNGFGHTVLYGTETRDLVKNILKGNKDAAGALAELAHVRIPGENLGALLSPTKLAANAYKDYARFIANADDAKELMAFFKQHNWLPSMLEQEQSIMNALTLRGTESASDLSKRLAGTKEAIKKIASPATRLNQGVEDMNRFVSAHTAKSISDIAVKHGLITEGEQLAYINTFVNRTNGNFIANQRPMLFQGPVGQAVGLFQTYQFNLMQQLFRYVGEGKNKSAALLLGLQGTVYGMNGLPMFNAINTHIVGNAAGNTTHKDIISQTYETTGKELGDWLMYGVASNSMLFPDAKVNLYSRGDINPRQVTVIPTNPADVPFIGASIKFFSNLKTTAERLGAGGDVYGTLLQGVEHAGVSRPLAGMAQVMQAFGNEDMVSYSTTSKGSIIGANDLFSLTTFARIAGGRPLDEAIANDAVYRIKAYSAAKSHEINTLGSAIKSKIQAGSLTSEDVNAFTEEYMKRGGKQDQFSKFMMRQMKSANVSTANQLANDLKNPINQNMQAVMGGMNLQDLANIN